MAHANKNMVSSVKKRKHKFRRRRVVCVASKLLFIILKNSYISFPGGKSKTQSVIETKISNKQFSQIGKEMFEIYMPIGHFVAVGT